MEVLHVISKFFDYGPKIKYVAVEGDEEDKEEAQSASKISLFKPPKSWDIIKLWGPWITTLIFGLSTLILALSRGSLSSSESFSNGWQTDFGKIRSPNFTS
jgi:hypothetical protein